MLRGPQCFHTKSARHAFCCALVVALLACARPAPCAAEDGGDGVYGRFRADFSLALAAGAGVVIESSNAEAAAAFDVHARYLDIAGPFVAAHIGSDDVYLVGVELRPLFPVLFLQNRFTGERFADLLVQSLAVELGAALFPARERVSAGLALGFAAEAPLWTSDTSGARVSLRVAARHVRARTSDDQGPGVDRALWHLHAALVLALPVRTGLATFEGRPYAYD